MKEVKIRLECHLCGKFRKTIIVYKNEYGYFSIPDAYCPECLGMMNQIIDGEEHNAE